MAGTTLGTAYVQIVPSAQGIKGSISNVLGGEAQSAGTSVGSKIGAFAKKAIIAAGIGTAVVKGIKASMAEGAKLQQSYLGGVDTLYGQAADSVRKYAREAAAAGISMNDYSEQAVSFGAALKNAYGGDTIKAMEAANTAILDMADNSAKMGTDIGSVQMAYQGFAKQNYTMLDNLKLGYGGTKTEMERLLADAQKLSGVEYNIDNLGDVYDAIHVIQQDLGLTGVAAKEASETFSGSFNAMKAAAANFLGSLALGEGVTEAMGTLLQSAATFFFGNFIPMLGQIVMSIPPAIGAFLMQGFPLLISSLSTMISNLATWISSTANNLTSTNVTAWASSTIPKLITAGVQLIGQFALTLIKNIPVIMNAVRQIGFNIVLGLGRAIWGQVTAAAVGIRDRFMTQINALRAMVSAAVSALRTNFMTHINTLRNNVASTAASIRDKFVQPIQTAKDKISGIVSKIKGFFPLNIGKLINFRVPSISLNKSSATVLGKTITYPTGFDVSWHAKGGIFTSPTLLQAADGSVHGLGDAGAEAIVPLDVLWSKMAEQSARSEAILAQQTRILNAIYEESRKEKNFKVDGVWAGRYVNSLVR